MHGISMDMNEDNLAGTLINLLKTGAAIPGLINIYDDKLKPRTEHAMDVFVLPKRGNYISHISTKGKLLKKRLSTLGVRW